MSETPAQPAVGWVASWVATDPNQPPSGRGGSGGAFECDTNTNVGWKVCFQFEGKKYSIDLCFAREIDAIAAAKAVNDFGGWPTDSLDSVVARCRQIGLPEIRKAMIESLAW